MLGNKVTRNLTQSWAWHRMVYSESCRMTALGFLQCLPTARNATKCYYNLSQDVAMDL